MFFKAKKESEINLEQHEQLEYAHFRIKQKKRLYTHFVIFLVGSVFLVLINKILKYGIMLDTKLNANNYKKIILKVFTS